MPPRPIASANISFGLVSVPVSLYSASESSATVSFNMLHKTCGTRLKQQYICPKEDVVVEKDEIAKGYEFSKGQYVTFTPEEIKALDEKATNSIDIAEFVPLSAVDRIYLDKVYYLGPDKGGDRAYRLLGEALKATGRAALGQYSARGKQHLVLVRPLDGVLVMEQLHYASRASAGRGGAASGDSGQGGRAGAGQAADRAVVHRRVPPGELSRHGAGAGARRDSAEGRGPGDHGRGSPAGDQDHRPDGCAEGQPRQAGASGRRSSRQGAAEADEEEEPAPRKRKAGGRPGSDSRSRLP